MRGTKLFKKYDGKYYHIFIGDLQDVRDAEEDDLRFRSINESKLHAGDVCMIDSGATVEYLGNGQYNQIERSPLYSSEKIDDLNTLQLRMFWKLTKNCVNGTYYGI